MVSYADEPQLLHAYIHNKKKSQMNVGPLRLPCGQLMYNSHGMANISVNSFASMFESRVSVASVILLTHGSVFESRVSVALILR